MRTTYKQQLEVIQKEMKARKAKLEKLRVAIHYSEDVHWLALNDVASTTAALMSGRALVKFL